MGEVFGTEKNFKMNWNVKQNLQKYLQYDSQVLSLS